MTRKEAIQAMKDGHKVTHMYFSKEEYIYMVDNIIFEENGYAMGTIYDEFMEIRTGEYWEKDWSIKND